MISKLTREYGKASQRCERGEFLSARGSFLVGRHGGFLYARGSFLVGRHGD